MFTPAILINFEGALLDAKSVEHEDPPSKDWLINSLSTACPNQQVLDVIDYAALHGVNVALISELPEHFIRRYLKTYNLDIEHVVSLAVHPLEFVLARACERLDCESEDIMYLSTRSHDNLKLTFNRLSTFYKEPLGRFDSSQRSTSDLVAAISKFVANRDGIRQSSPIIREGQHFAIGYYLPPINQLIWDFKDNVQDGVSYWLSKVTNLKEQLPKADYVVRVLGHDELSSINTSTSLDELARHTANLIGATFVPELLQKSRALKKSTELKSANERRLQVKSAYKVDTTAISVKPDAHISFLVVDDVRTSGATTNEIIRALNSVFPKASVNTLVLARTVFRNQQSEVSQHNAFLLNDLRELPNKQPDAPRQAAGGVNTHGLATKSFTAGLANTNHNFIIQNLPYSSIASQPYLSKELDVIAVCKNLIMRGVPTIASRYVQKELKLSSANTLRHSKPKALISKKDVTWHRLIRGDVKNDFYPAKHFLEHCVPKHFKDFSFVQKLLIPEVKLHEITQEYVKATYNRQVDFYLPQTGLVIEIDGNQHNAQLYQDTKRDEFLKRMGLTIVRFSTAEVLSENASFAEKIAEIVHHLQVHKSLEDSGKITLPNKIRLSDYQKAYETIVDVHDVSIRATAIIRLEVTLLELIERGVLRFGERNSVYLLNRDRIDFHTIAINDLSLLLSHVGTLRNLDNADLEIEVIEIKDLKKAPPGAVIIDFSILERYTDDFQSSPEIIFVRGHYLDFYKEIQQTSATEVTDFSLVEYDFFEMSCTQPVPYELNMSQDSPHRISLNYLLSNIFLPFIDDVDFREGQIGIISSALQRKDTIGLLPTGSGKSICYQMACLLQPGISFTVCPIKSLMYDQKLDLDIIGITRTNYITSDQSAQEKAKVQNEFGQGRYFFVFISPERFQTRKFRAEIGSIGLEKNFAYAVIDEVHCLSEWGHDFRTSYLNLADTIKNLSPEAVFIGLTATASVNVLRDIQNEFEILDENVRTPLSFTREELNFNVIDDESNKSAALTAIASEMMSKWSEIAPELKGAGIIFTPTVNGRNGCHSLSEMLTRELNTEVRFYSGSQPKYYRSSNESFDSYKRKVQDDFKQNKYELLVATKAFGMGVNKGNIAYTIHYGIPGSMEALYQEAGRAGREKTLFKDAPADCLVLLTKEDDEKSLEKLWAPETTVTDLKALSKKLNSGDISTNLFMLANSLETINADYLLMNQVFHLLYGAPDKLVQTIHARNLQSNKFRVEKTIYRLSQLGIVSDWIVEDFIAGSFEVSTVRLTPEEVELQLERLIRKYESDFSLSSIEQTSNEFYQFIEKRYKKGVYNKYQRAFLVLLLWSYDHFVYNRRQSLKTVYEQCSQLSAGTITSVEFKSRLEGYFKFNQATDLIQYVAENPRDITSWFAIFYEPSSNSSKNPVLITQSKVRTLQDQLSRFLESYKDNPGLDYLSGLTRLINNDFDNSDGDRRMLTALQKLKSYERADVDTVLQNTLALSTLMTPEAQGTYAKIFLSYFPDEEWLNHIHETIEDPYTTARILGSANDKLKELVRTIKEIEL